MSKLKAAWGWLLRRTTPQICAFQMAVWMPLWAIFWVPYLTLPSPPLTEPLGYWGLAWKMLTLVFLIYTIFLPMIFDAFKDHINKKNKNIN